MELTEKDRLGTRLLALNLRHFELNREMEQTQIRVRQLESEIEDARLAGFLGENGGDATSLTVALEAERAALERRKATVENVTEIRWKARVQHAVAGLKERKAAQERIDGVDDGSSEEPPSP